MNLENINKRNQTQKSTVHDSIYMKCPKQANPQRGKDSQQLPEASARRGWEMATNGMEFLWGEKCSEIR